MFKETADIQTADMLKLPVPEAHYHSVVLKPSETQKEMVASLSERAERVRNKMVDSSVDNMLLINAVPHSVVLMRAQDAETAKQLAADVEANLNPAKWVCVEAEKTAVLVHNCTVLLVMSWSDVTDALTANFNALWS